MPNWTKKEEALLRRLRDNGTPPAEIAERLGRTPGAICQHAVKRMGLKLLRAPKRFWCAADVRRLYKLFPVKSISDIATELGRTEQSVRDRAKAEGLYRRDFPL